MEVNDMKRKRQVNKIDFRQKRMCPNPNYSQFKKPDYVDSLGREYKIATESQANELIDSIDGYGAVVMFIRIPSRLKNTVEFPNSQMNEIINLIHSKQYTESTATVEKCMHAYRRKTGYVVLRNMKNLGMADPTKWNSIMDKGGGKKLSKVHF